MPTSPSIASVVNELRNQNANLPTEKKQNIIVVQDTGAGSQGDKSGQMLTVLNSIFNAISEQLRLTRESLRLQQEDRLAARDFQKEAMDVSSGKYEPPQAGGGGGVIEQAGKVGGGLWESAKGLGKAVVGVAAKHPIATAVGAGAAIGLGTREITKNLGADPSSDVGLKLAAFTSTIEATGSLQNRADVLQSMINRASQNHSGYGKNLFKQVSAKSQYTPISAALGMGAAGDAAAQRVYGRIGLSKQELYEILSKPNGLELLEKRFGGKGDAQAAQKLIEDFKKGGELSQNAKEFVGGRTDYRGAAVSNKWKSRAIHRGGSGGNYFGSVNQGKLAGSLEDLGFKEETPSPSSTGTATKISTGNNQQPKKLNTELFDISGMSGSKNKEFQERFNMLNPEFAGRLAGLSKDYEKATGHRVQNIAPSDMYRTYQEQVATKRSAIAKGRPGNAATPGYSAHGLGLAVDFGTAESIWAGKTIDPQTGKTYAEKWGVHAITPGNKGKIEPWHLTPRELSVPEMHRIQKGLFAGKSGRVTGAEVAAGAGLELENIALKGKVDESQETKLAKTGRHQLERTDEKSSVLQASMFAPLEKAIDKMSDILTSIDKNTGKTEENTKEIKTATKEAGKGESKETATKTDEEKEYTAADFLSDDDKKKYDEAQQKALDESLKTGKKEITEDDVMKHMSDEDKAKYNTAKETAKAASTKEPTASKVDEGQDQSGALASMMGGSDEGSNVMKMLFGQGGVMGSAEPIEPGSEKRKYIDSLPSYPDKLGQMVKNLILGEGDVDVNDALGALSQSDVMGGTATPQGTGDQLGNLGVTPTMPKTFSESLLGELQNKPLIWKSGAEKPKENEAETPLGNAFKDIFKDLPIMGSSDSFTEASKPEADLSKLKSDQLSNLGVNPFGGQQGGMLNNIFSGGMPNTGNNPFYSMQGMLGKIGSVANMGMNVGGMMKQGGMGGARGVMGQVGGVLRGMGSGFPMAQGIGGMLGNVGNIMGSVQKMQNIGQGGMGGIMGGIGAASNMLGSLGNIFGNVQGIGGGLGNMMGGLGVTPFGGGGMGSSIGSTVGSIGGNIFGGPAGGMLSSMGGSLLGGIGESLIGGGSSGTASSGSGLAGGLSNIGDSVGNLFGGIGDSIGGLFGGGDSGGSKGISSLGIGDDAASLKQTYSETPEPVGGNLGFLQSSNEELAASSPQSSGGSSAPRGGGSPADTGTITSSQGASAAPKAGAGARTGTSSGAMGVGMEGYNDCPTLYKWQFRTSYWGKV